MSGSKVDVKVVLLGMHDVGKTCLVERYLHGKFKFNVTATVGAAFGAKKVDVNGQGVTLGIWDTAGAERYESMSRIYYRSARAAIVCYDLTNKASFDKVEFWIKELLQNEENCDIYIVGTKLDLVQDGTKERGMPEGSVEEYARTIGGDVFETSAKTGHNINDLFYKIARDYLRKKKGPVDGGSGGAAGGSSAVKLSDRPQQNSGGCPC
mmetsp:Transcript_14592/g.57294  ORF Transcript_14592/g.57294 Transcript_14592/m.57294 type:complete len:209 (+) Transcript_14592:154-780(+)|eukprot:CAMPEP_0114629774 /NCGR_PEP_ID=MMETSP0168-20121206/13537_1 /TAXON_ID=95228 ORGANISM="Vannella sp., Strain DIVA3 517/6/12" /NCGR_SAMPLE_ID=MMETSP0168 /ASSEMBLY_ACC=CAM_ASM_000044 /LENGTH=208 /DNA_ID=CAMNT_0001841253 /DNA_START=105 /DNA_END=731 /DNA_ORIENTATION=+